jgi:uncharacterized membrane protein YqjE
MSSFMSDDTPESTQAPGAATGLFRSLTNLFATLVTLAQTRLELLTTELQEEVQRAVGLVVWGMVALLAAMIGLILGGLTIVFVYWDTHRVLAASLVTAGFFALAVIAVLVLIAKFNSRPRFLDTTLTELARDSQSLTRKVNEQ